MREADRKREQDRESDEHARQSAELDATSIESENAPQSNACSSRADGPPSADTGATQTTGEAKIGPPLPKSSHFPTCGTQ